jgi:hypothetical protein
MKMAIKKILIILLMISFLNFVGCSSLETVTKKEYDEDKNEINFNKELYVTTNDNIRRHFLPGEYAIKNDTLFYQGAVENNDGVSKFSRSIPMDNIISFEQNKPDYLNTTGLILSILAVGMLVLGFIWINAIEDTFFPNN